MADLGHRNTVDCHLIGINRYLFFVNCVFIYKLIFDYINKIILSDK